MWWMGYSSRKCPRKKKQMPSEKAKDVGLTAKEEIMWIMKETTDCLYSEKEDRFVHLHDLDSKFGFLLDVKRLLLDSKESTSIYDLNILKKSCLNLGQFYNTDIDGFQLYKESQDCKMLLKVMQMFRPQNPRNYSSLLFSMEMKMFFQT